MNFIIICIGAIAALGLVAALASLGGKDEPINQGHDCTTCSSMADGSCKIACLMEEKKKRENNKTEDKAVS